MTCCGRERTPVWLPALLQLQQADIIPPFILDVRVFLLCRETAEGMRLSRIHMSLPSSGQEEGEFFPCRLTAESNRLLEKMVREKSAEIEARNRDLQMHHPEYSRWYISLFI